MRPIILVKRLPAKRRKPFSQFLPKEAPKRGLLTSVLALIGAYVIGLAIGWYAFSPRGCDTDAECRMTPPCVLTPTCDGGPYNQPARWLP